MRTESPISYGLTQPRKHNRKTSHNKFRGQIAKFGVWCEFCLKPVFCELPRNWAEPFPRMGKRGGAIRAVTQFTDGGFLCAYVLRYLLSRPHVSSTGMGIRHEGEVIRTVAHYFLSAYLTRTNAP